MRKVTGITWRCRQFAICVALRKIFFYPTNDIYNSLPWKYSQKCPNIIFNILRHSKAPPIASAIFALIWFLWRHVSLCVWRRRGPGWGAGVVLWFVSVGSLSASDAFLSRLFSFNLSIWSFAPHRWNHEAAAEAVAAALTGVSRDAAAEGWVWLCSIRPRAHKLSSYAVIIDNKATRPL